MKQIPFTTIRALHQQLKPGSPWFDAGAISFFRTVLPQYGFEVRGGFAFVTAETSLSGEKRFSVRYLHSTTGGIETLGGFHHFPSQRAATARIQGLVDELLKEPA
jgi:hypothetical protein